MGSKSQSYQLGEVCSRLSSGKSIHSQDIDEAGPFPVMGGNGLRGYTTKQNFSGECAIIGRQGAACGNVRYFNGSGYMTEHAVVVQATAEHNTRYLYYLLSTMQLGRLSAQSAQPGLSVKTLAKQVVELPDRATQDAVTYLLGLIDDKIELNNRLNDYLLKLIDALFVHWFKEFAPFQGEETYESEIGNIPVSIKLVPLAGLTTVITKGTTPTTLGFEYGESGINFIKGESILDNHSFDYRKFAHIDDETNVALKRSIIEDRDLLFTIAGTLGRFAMAERGMLPANANQAVGIIRADKKLLTPEVLLSYFIGGWHKDYYSRRVQQAVQANLSLTTLKSLPVPILEGRRRSEYESQILPVVHAIEANNTENRRLAELRDALLPKLMSGEIDVSKIEI